MWLNREPGVGLLLVPLFQQPRDNSEPMEQVRCFAKKKKGLCAKSQLTWSLAGIPTKVVKGTGAKPKVPASPIKAASKAVNYERSLGVAYVPGPPAGGRPHSDTLASMPMQDKMKVGRREESARDEFCCF